MTMDSYSSDSSYSTYPSETSLSDANSPQYQRGSTNSGGRPTNVKCRYFLNSGYCFYGDACQFLHVTPGAQVRQKQDSYGSGEDDSAFLPTAPVFVPSQNNQHNESSKSRLFNKTQQIDGNLQQQFRRMRLLNQVNNAEQQQQQQNYHQHNERQKALPSLQLPTNKTDPTSFFMSRQMRDELKKQRNVLLSENKDPDLGLPDSIENYHSLYPLEDINNQTSGQRVFGYVSTCYRVVNSKDGLHYCMRRIHGFRLLNPKAVSSVEKWKKISNSNIVPLKEAFTTKAFNDTSLIFVYAYYPGAETIMSRHFNKGPGAKSPNAESSLSYWQNNHQGHSKSGYGNSPKTIQKVMPERLIWSYVIQLTAAIRHIHSEGLSCRKIDPSKVLLIGNSRLRFNCPGILDVIFSDNDNHTPAMISRYQQEDLVELGKLVLALACYSIESVQREAIPSSIEFVSRNYSNDLKTLIWNLMSSQVTSNPHSINDVMPMIGARFYSQLDATQSRCDLLENELYKEMDNGRLLRLLAKMGTILERSEFNMDPEWSETGDRYLLKLFRDYLFHQVTETGAPWIDFSHIVSTLNKLDAGSSERICLTSRDELSILVVSYHDLKACLETAFQELVPSAEIS